MKANSGFIRVAEGGDLIVPPELFRELAKEAARETVAVIREALGGDACGKSEPSGPEFVCDMCGAADTCPSEIELRAGYGSAHDMEKRTFHICAGCLDELWKLLDDED